jgi:hypothetical protein
MAMERRQVIASLWAFLGVSASARTMEQAKPAISKNSTRSELSDYVQGPQPLPTRVPSIASTQKSTSPSE